MLPIRRVFLEFLWKVLRIFALSLFPVSLNAEPAAKIAVPVLREVGEELSKETISSRGLGLGESTYKYDAAVGSGKVISTSPPGGRLVNR